METLSCVGGIVNKDEVVKGHMSDCAERSVEGVDIFSGCEVKVDVVVFGSH